VPPVGTAHAGNGLFGIYSKVNVPGLDVHQVTIVANVRQLQPQGDIVQLVGAFWTRTSDPRHMLEGLKAQGVAHVAMAAIGVLGKPVWNVLDG